MNTTLWGFNRRTLLISSRWQQWCVRSRQNKGNRRISPTLEAGRLGGSIWRTYRWFWWKGVRTTVDQFVAYEAPEPCSCWPVLIADGTKPTEPDLGVRLCSIAIPLIPHYLLGEGPLLKELQCLGQCSAGKPQVLPSMRVLLWHVPKPCCRPHWHFIGNIIPWCPWPLSAGPQIPQKNQTRSDRIMHLDDFWSIRKMSENCPRSTVYVSGWGWLHLQRQTVWTNLKNLFMLVIYGPFSYFGLYSHLPDFHCGLFKLDHLPAAVGLLIQIAAI